jgi:NADPH2:quinone reductase
MKAILLRRPGGPEALEYVEVPTPVPGEGKVLVNSARAPGVHVLWKRSI